MKANTKNTLIVALLFALSVIGIGSVFAFIILSHIEKAKIEQSK